jgi:uncharacterized membrane protein YraQ (UPF0718 family)
MMDDVLWILEFMGSNFIHILPYMLVSIPVAVMVRVSNASQYIRKAMTGHPAKAILLATIVGAFSPFCSCSVIPLVASLLLAGVPLPPVMAFWIASPSMDPEIFVMSVGLLGWQLAVARILGTLILSIASGFFTLWLSERGYFKGGVVREQQGTLSVSWAKVWGVIRLRVIPQEIPLVTVAASPISMVSGDADQFGQAMSQSPPITIQSDQGLVCAEESSCSVSASDTTATEKTARYNWTQLRQESVSVTWMLVQFMALAHLMEALILLYVPQDVIIATLGSNNPLSVLFATAVGIPAYTTNLTALPLISGLMEQGMSGGAALAFLIAGPTTTLPAMAAVRGIASNRVFAVYLGLALIGTLVIGYSYSLLELFL